MEPMENGVHAWHAGATRCAAALIQAHGDAVSTFADEGHDGAMQAHPVPEICSSEAGVEPTGFVGFEEGEKDDMTGGTKNSTPVTSDSDYDEDGCCESWGGGNRNRTMDHGGDYYGYNCTRGMPCSNRTLEDADWCCGSGATGGNRNRTWNCTRDMHCVNRTPHGEWDCSGGRSGRCTNSTFDSDGKVSQQVQASSANRFTITLPPRSILLLGAFVSFVWYFI
jgi:hypothetical protein